MLIHAFSLSASHFVSCTVEVPSWPPCFYWFFGSCFGSHDEAGLLAFEELQGLPRPARGTPWQELLWKKPPLRTSTCGISTVLLWLADAIRHCFLMLALLRPSRRNKKEKKSAAKRPPAVAKSTPTAAKLGCAFSHSAERIVDELGLLYPENRGNLRKNMASV